MTLKDILREITNYANLELYDNEEFLNAWGAWYSGKTKWHNYTVYNGKRHVKLTRMTLGMAKRVCEDWANLLINEKTDITLGDEVSQNTLNDILRDCHFWRKANEGVEKTFALGIGAWVISVEDLGVAENGTIDKKGTVNISFLNGKKIIPITIEDDRIVECAFINANTNKTYISVHLRDGDNGNYRIHNISASGKDINNLTYNPAEDYYIFDTQNKLPWFFILKPNIANNIDINSPLGISIYANALDILRETDLIYDSYANEFMLGKKRVYINARQMTINTANGEEVNTFDSNDVVHYVLPESDDGSFFMQDNTQTLRVTDHQTALQNQLNLLSYACGFGTQHYRYDGGNISTATQIISENSEMFRNIKKHEILLEDALVGLVKTVIYATNTFTPLSLKEGASIEIKFDDSIIEDKAAEMANDRLDVAMGVMSKAEFRAKWYNEDLETAQQKIDEMSSTTIVDDDDTPPDGGNSAQDGKNA